MKYVILLDKGIEEVRITGETANHSDLVKEWERVISAGFCSFDSDGVSCWGRSVSLKKKSLEQDSKIIERCLKIAV